MTAQAATRWQDWLSFALGLWLAMSPWLLDYAEHEGATANAAFLGLALALGSHFEVSCDAVSAEWLNIAGGAWLVCSPFVLGFSHAFVPTANTIAVGTLAMALAASAMSLDKELTRWVQSRFVRP